MEPTTSERAKAEHPQNRKKVKWRLTIKGEVSWEKNNEGIVHFKNEYNFWIARAKKVRNVKFYRSNSIISKIMSPSFLQFSVLKGITGWKFRRSDVTRAENGSFKPEYLTK